MDGQNQGAYNQSSIYNPFSLTGGFQQSLYNHQRMPGEIQNAFTIANLIGSQNLASRAPVDQERVRQQGALARIQSMGPLLQQLFGGGGGAGGFKTDYGAGIGFNTKPPNLPSYGGFFKQGG